MIARVRRWYWKRASDKIRQGLDEALREIDEIRQDILRIPFIDEDQKARLGKQRDQ